MFSITVSLLLVFVFLVYAYLTEGTRYYPKSTVLFAGLIFIFAMIGLALSDSMAANQEYVRGYQIGVRDGIECEREAKDPSASEFTSYYIRQPCP